MTAMTTAVTSSTTTAVTTAATTAGAAAVTAGTTAAVKAGPIQLRPHASAQRAVMTVATSCLAHADANQPHLGIDDPEVLHQFRVAYRRLRSLFSLARELPRSDPQGARLKGDLRELTSAFGLARDLDVFVETNPDLPEADRAKVEQARVAAYATVAETVDSARWHHLHEDLDRWLDKGRWRKALDDDPWTGRSLARRALNRRRSRIVTMGADLAGLSEHDRHQVRIEAKKLRYGCQFFAAMWPGHEAEISALESKLSKLQDTLGALNDHATWQHMADVTGIETAEPAHLDLATQLAKAQKLVTEITASKPFWRAE